MGMLLLVGWGLNKLAVVPANAGTHTLRRFNSGDGVATPVNNHNRRWLWVPAFAGTTRGEDCASLFARSEGTLTARARYVILRKR
jgi:hypothetical protein